MLDLENECQGHGVHRPLRFRSTTNISIYNWVPYAFLSSSHHSEIATCKMFDLEGFGQSHVVQHLRLRNSTPNIRINKCLIMQIAALFTFFTLKMYVNVKRYSILNFAILYKNQQTSYCSFFPRFSSFTRY